MYKNIIVSLMLCGCSDQVSLNQVSSNPPIIDSKLLTNTNIEQFYKDGVLMCNVVTISPNWEYVVGGKYYYTPELPLGTSAFDAANYGASSAIVIKRVDQAVRDAIRNSNSDKLIMSLTF